jgi:hypothetical protein
VKTKQQMRDEMAEVISNQPVHGMPMADCLLVADAIIEYLDDAALLSGLI